jgi:hypothetical protein
MKKAPIIQVAGVILLLAGCGEEGNKGVCDLLNPDCDEWPGASPTASCR